MLSRRSTLAMLGTATFGLSPSLFGGLRCRGTENRFKLMTYKKLSKHTKTR